MTYEELCSFEVLYKAYLEARKGKRSKSKTIEYEAQALACTEKLSRKLAVCNAVSYTHLRAHETDSYLVCRLLLEKKKKKKQHTIKNI